MHGEEPEVKPDQRCKHMRSDARRRRPADARVQDDEERTHGYRKEGEDAGEI